MAVGAAPINQPSKAKGESLGFHRLGFSALMRSGAEDRKVQRGPAFLLAFPGQRAATGSGASWCSIRLSCAPAHIFLVRHQA